MGRERRYRELIVGGEKDREIGGGGGGGGGKEKKDTRN